MIVCTNNKNKVDLNDYPFKLDIHRRRCVFKFSPFERDLFYEMCLGSLETSVEELAEDMDVDAAIILAVLKKNHSIGLYNIKDKEILINKEERRFYEVELDKFNESFVPNLNHIKALFNKISIDILPKWFSLPKNCTCIFSTLVENHFATPKLYEKYLEEIEFNEPLLNKIIDQLYSSPYYSLNLEELKETLYLSDEILYQMIALLEFNLVAVHSYQKIGDTFHEVLTPPHEYRVLLLDKLEKRPKCINEDEKAITVYTLHQEFIPKMTKTLSTIKEFVHGDKQGDLHLDDLKMIKKLLEIDLLDSVDEQILLSREGNAFLQQSEVEKPLHFLTPRNHKKRLFSEWAQRQIEKELLQYTSWIFIDDFVNSLHIPLDTHAPLALVKKGRQSFYSVPVYSPEEKELLRKYLTDYLAVANVVELGETDGKAIFRLTPFGRDTLM